MKRLCLLLTLCSALLGAQTRQLGEGRKRVALVIGNDAYTKLPVLSNAVKDARAMSASLRNARFEVTIVENGNREVIERAVQKFIDKLDRGDVALFYYSGHGLQFRGENYLAPVDLPTGDPILARTRSINAIEVLERMSDAGTDLQILILDACRSNPFGMRGESTGLAPMKAAARGTFIAYATSPGMTASDNTGAQNGLYTAHLLTAMHQPGLPLEEVFKRAAEAVQKASGGSQIPWTSSSVSGNFYFNVTVNVQASPQKQEVSPAAGVTGTKLSAADEAWALVRDSKTPDDFDLFAQTFPGSELAAAARLRATQLRRAMNASGGASPPAPSASTPSAAGRYDFAHDRDLLPFVQAGKWGLMNRKGQVVLAPQYDLMVPFSERLATVRSGDKYGAIDLQGKLVLPAEFFSLGSFREGLAPACREKEKCGYVNPAGQWVIQPVYKGTLRFSEGLASVVAQDGRRYFIDRNGRQVIEAIKVLTYFSQGRIVDADDKGLWGFRDKSGQWVIQPQYEAVGPFFRGTAPVKLNGKWQFIDLSGRVTASTDADTVSNLELFEPLIAARRNGKWGFVDPSGKWVIQPTYNLTSVFLDGVVQVTTEEGRGWIDRNGQWVIKPSK